MNLFFILPLIFIYAYVGTISSSMLNERYKKRIILSIICLIFGIVFGIFTNDERKFSYIAFGFLPLLHIFCYEILRFIFKPLIGKYSYSPYREKIGSKVNGKGYPENRKVKLADYFFALTLLFLPITIMLFIIHLVNL